MLDLAAIELADSGLDDLQLSGWQQEFLLLTDPWSQLFVALPFVLLADTNCFVEHNSWWVLVLVGG